MPHFIPCLLLHFETSSTVISSTNHIVYYAKITVNDKLEEFFTLFFYKDEPLYRHQP